MLRGVWGITKRPLSISPSNKWVEIFCFPPLPLPCLVNGSCNDHQILVHRPTVKKAKLPLNPTSNKHWLIQIAKRSSSEQESACFQACDLPVKSQTNVSVWLEKRWSCHGNHKLSIHFYTLVLTSVWLKASTNLDQHLSQRWFFGRSCAWYGFMITNLEGQKSTRWKCSYLPLQSMH